MRTAEKENQPSMVGEDNAGISKPEGQELTLTQRLLDLLKILYSSLGTTFLSVLLISYCTHAALKSILLKSDRLLLITTLIVSAGVSWTVVLGTLGMTKLRQTGWYYAAALFSVGLYCLYTGYRLWYAMRDVAFMKIGVTLFVALIAAKVLRSRIDSHDIDTKAAMLFISASVGMVLGGIFLFWVTPLLLIVK